MIVSTTENVPGHNVQEILGVTRGNVIRAKHVGTDIIASFRAIIGMRFTTSTVMANSAEILAFGTAVKLVRS